MIEAVVNFLFVYLNIGAVLAYVLFFIGFNSQFYFYQQNKKEFAKFFFVGVPIFWVAWPVVFPVACLAIWEDVVPAWKNAKHAPQPE